MAVAPVDISSETIYDRTRPRGFEPPVRFENK